MWTHRHKYGCLFRWLLAVDSFQMTSWTVWKSREFLVVIDPVTNRANIYIYILYIIYYMYSRIATIAHVWAHQGMLEYVWKCLYKFRNIWNCMDTNINFHILIHVNVCSIWCIFCWRMLSVQHEMHVKLLTDYNILKCLEMYEHILNLGV